MDDIVGEFNDTKTRNAHNAEGHLKHATGALAQMLKESGLSQTDLAVHMGVDRSCVSHYLKGRRMPSFSHFRLMREALGVTADALSDALATAHLTLRRQARRTAA